MYNEMLTELAVSIVMVVMTVLIHAAGIYAMTRFLKLEAREEAEKHVSPFSSRGVAVTLTIVLGLFALHGIEIWAYGFLYLFLGAIPTLHEAIYFSTITYSTIGYDDDALQEAWRLVAAIEGVNGVILLGWSTAFFVSVVARMGRG